jgi:hypothetical protein
MASEEHAGREERGSEPEAPRPDVPGELGPVSDDEGQEDEYAGPDPERVDDPRVPEEDQGV